MRVLFIFFVVSFCVNAEQVYYDIRYDYYDIEHFVQNTRLLTKYMDCFLDKGPCTPIGKIFKAILPEIVQTACAKCTPTQKRFARKVFNAFMKYVPDGYIELRQQLDPRNKFYENFDDAISRA